MVTFDFNCVNSPESDVCYVAVINKGFENSKSARIFEYIIQIFIPEKYWELFSEIWISKNLVSNVKSAVKFVV